jgi:hypothetical protein
MKSAAALIQESPFDLTGHTGHSAGHAAAGRREIRAKFFALFFKLPKEVPKSSSATPLA